MDCNEAVSPPESNRHNNTCPFCEGKQELKLLGYVTKHGELKNEDELGRNLAARGKVDTDSQTAMPFKPFDGGGDDHKGWTADEDAFEDIDIQTEIPPTPHHLIPGKASMAKAPSLEKWTTTEAQGSKLKEDIGYSIDCTENGIWLPHIPHPFGTRIIPGQKKSKKKKKKFSDEYGAWHPLRNPEQREIGYVIMYQTKRQMHYTNHSAPYKHDDNPDVTYDGEAKQRCVMLGGLMNTFWKVKCPKAQDSADDKYFPPYGLVERINLQSLYMRGRLLGGPKRWRSWVSVLAQDLTHDLRAKRIKDVTDADDVVFKK